MPAKPNTTLRALEREVRAAEKKHAALTKKLAKARQKHAEPVRDYTLDTTNGPVTLATLFGGRDELIVIHNMGRGCAYCTMWADGFNGLLPHLQNRVAFVVVSPDAPDAQAKFAQSRGWRFAMASSRNSSFVRDLGYETDDGVLPGASALQRRKDGSIVRTGKAVFGPGDPFNGAFHLFDMLPGGSKTWSPRFSYSN